MAPLRIIALLACSAVLTACATFPELEGKVSPDAKNAEYLPFLDFRQLQAVATLETVDLDLPIDARIAALRNRAAALRGPIFSASDRTRLTGS